MLKQPPDNRVQPGYMTCTGDSKMMSHLNAQKEILSKSSHFLEPGTANSHCNAMLWYQLIHTKTSLIFFFFVKKRYKHFGCSSNQCHASTCTHPKTTTTHSIAHYIFLAEQYFFTNNLE